MLGPSPATHGFSNARGIKAVVPYAYSIIDREVRCTASTTPLVMEQAGGSSSRGPVLSG